MKVPESIKKFVDIFSALPGIGPRQAIRLAFYFVRSGISFQDEAIGAIADLKKIQLCKNCFYIHENANELCDYCGDKGRDQSVIAVVEKETDIISMENTGKFNGRYLVLGDLRRNGVLEPSQRLRIKSLIGWIEGELNGSADEIIIATSPTVEGGIIADIIAQELKPFAKKISRLGRGIPTGGEVEFADQETLGSAIIGRG